MTFSQEGNSSSAVGFPEAPMPATFTLKSSRPNLFVVSRMLSLTA
jgi:hypothetical protein